MVSRARGLRPAVFLDRDGVIVIPEFRDRRSFAPRRLADFKLYPDAGPSLSRLKREGFLLAVVTNQPDVGRGLVLRSEVEAMHQILRRELPIDTLKACFHQQDEHCDCRKPKPGMILAAADELGIDLARSFMVGDRGTDVAAGRAAGCATVFIDLGYDEPAPDAPDHVVHSVAEAAEIIIQTAATAQGTA
ncbi:MAG TPA: HAD family hydrolase [Xanthobacteraceae bacterium]|jgi:D-glycero-D-manno-heptose 1,7-bisphosphate phosphatase